MGSICLISKKRTKGTEENRQMYEEKKERECIATKEQRKEAKEQQEAMCIALKIRRKLIRFKIEKKEVDKVNRWKHSQGIISFAASIFLSLYNPRVLSLSFQVSMTRVVISSSRESFYVHFAKFGLIMEKPKFMTVFFLN